MEKVKDTILESLREHSGYLPLTSESESAEIQRYVDLDKSAFNKGVAALADEGRVELDGGGVSLVVEKTVSGAKFRKIKRRRR